MVTGALEAKAPRSTTIELVEATEPRSLRARLRAARPLVALNWTLAVMLFIDLIGELIIYGTAYTLVMAIPAAAIFGQAARVQSRSEEPSQRWLRIAGWSSAFLGGLCLLSFYGSLMAPVDVACAATSSIFGAAFAASAYYQLKLLRR